MPKSFARCSWLLDRGVHRGGLEAGASMSVRSATDKNRAVRTANPLSRFARKPRKPPAAPPLASAASGNVCALHKFT
jgi:hypothetical protein